MPSLCLLLLLPVQVDARPPTARIDFPTPSALTDARELRVRGAASDASGVAAVRVNGVPASTADAFATWTALVPLEVGENVLVVETLDVLGNGDPAAASTVVRRDAALLGTVGFLALDQAAGRAYVVDQTANTPSPYPIARVLEVDLRDGSLSVLSPGDHDAPTPSNLNSGVGEVEFDAHGERLLLATAFPGELIAIDLRTGARTVVAGPDLGSGPSLFGCLGLEVDPLAPRAWLLRFDSSSVPDEPAVLEVDLSTGDRKVLASESGGSTKWPSFGTCRLELLPGGEALVFANDDELISVEIATGVVRTLADPSGALGEPWSYVRCVAADPFGLAYVSSSTDGVVFGLDTASGAYATVLEEPLRAKALYVDLEVDAAWRRLLALDLQSAALVAQPLGGGPAEVAARSAVGGGYSLGSGKLQALALEGQERVWLLDRARGEVLAVELADGQRRLVSGPTRGSGVALDGLQDAVFDDSGPAPRLLVLDVEAGGLVAVDPLSGDRALVSGAGVGGGDPFVLSGMIPYPLLQVERIGGTAWVLDFGAGFGEKRLVRVDLATGDRTLVSGDGVGSGPALDSGDDLALDPLRGRALVASYQRVYAVDLVTGARSEFSGPNVGSGPALDSSLLDLAWDEQGDRLLAHIGEALMAVDGATGDRTLLYERDPSMGPGFAFGVERLALLRPAQDAAPLLLYSDALSFGVGVLDLAAVGVDGRVSGHHALLSR